MSVSVHPGYGTPHTWNVSHLKDELAAKAHPPDKQGDIDMENIDWRKQEILYLHA